MPAQKHRRIVRFDGGLRVGDATNYTEFGTQGQVTGTGKGRIQKDHWISWREFSACSLGGSAAAANSGSNTDPITVSGSFPVLGFKNTLSACAVWASTRFPLDAATSGSVQLLADWTFVKTAGSAAVLGACVYYVQGGSVISDAGAFAGSGIKAVSSLVSTACSITTSSFANIRSFGASTTGDIVVKFWRDGTSASDSSGSEFGLVGLRLRYVSSTPGPASNE